MAQNYTRQSSMADGDTITAALFNNEYNQLVNAFAYSSSSASSTGHRHDGSTGQGGNVPQIGDLDFLNKVVVDGTNNRVGFFVEVSSSAVEQVRVQDGAIVPVTDNDIDLGTSSLEFKDLFLDGTAHVDTLDVDVNATIAGTLGVTGVLTGSSLDISGDIDIDGTSNLDVVDIDGAVDMATTLNVAGVATVGGLTIGSAVITEAELETIDTITAGTITASKAVVVDSNKDVSSFRNVTLTGELDAATGDFSGNVDIDGDLLVGDDLTLDSDAAVLGFGADTDVTLTHVADTGLLLNSTMALQFNDASQFINAPSATVLDINATDEIELNATLVDINANVEVSGTLTVAGAVDFGDAALSNVGAVQLDSIAGDADSNTSITFSGSDVITIAAGGDNQVTFTNGAIVPSTDNDIDLGTSSVEFKDAFFDGTVTTDALVADTADINGGTVDGAIIGGNSAAAITGTAITGTSFVIGSADISEAELETIDGVTAGTVAASKAVVVDANKDIGSFRNITLTGELDAGSLDISGDADIDGTLETDALSINGTAVTSTAAELNILDGVTSTAAELNILDGVTASAADINLIDGITNGTVIASKAIITDSNKDITGGRNITISGELDAATLDISGDADIDGTLETDALSINGTAVTSTAAELNILDGVTSTAAELNILDGVTSTAAELNTLDGITAVVGELNALDLGSTAVGTAIASKAVILDSNKDYTGIRNFTISGELDAASLDISGDIDVDGTTNLDVVDIDGAVDMASTLTVGGATTITVADNSDVLTLISTDADANQGPILNLFRNSGSPADSDVLAQVLFSGENDADEEIEYSRFQGFIVDASDGTEDGGLNLQGMLAGTLRSRLKTNATELVINDDSQDLDFRVESSSSANALKIDAGDNTIEFGSIPFTSSAGTSNFRAGVNAGNSITSGANSNALVGDEAGTALTTGDYNAAFGQNALASNVTGSRNTAIGRSALATLNPDTEASYNTAVGYAAGGAVTTGTNNVLVGGLAGDALTDADYNIAVGVGAVGSDTLGSGAIGIGQGALGQQNFTTATTNYNVGIGYAAGANVTTGVKNTIVGGLAGDALTDADENVAIGVSALGADTLGSKTTAIGQGALQVQNFTTATDTYNVAVGFSAGNQITTGLSNTIIGGLAGDALTDADFNVALGRSALTDDTLGSKTVAVGYNALGSQNFTTATDTFNTAVGFQAGVAVTTGIYNTLIGGLAGDALTTGNNNVAIGLNALTNDTKGDQSVAIGNDALNAQNFTTNTDAFNVAVGKSAGAAVTTGIQNTIIGALAGDALTDADYNVAVGLGALSADTLGSKSTAIGTNTLQNQNLTTATDSFNTALGFHAGYAVTTGVQNTIVGALAGDAMTTGDSNTFIGYFAAGNGVVTGDTNTAVGVSAGLAITSGSNNLCLGKDSGRTGSPGGNLTTHSNNVVLGDENISALYAQVALTVSSDERDKTDFVDLDLGLDFVKALEPVTYYWDKRSKYGDKDADDYDLDNLTPDGTHKEDWMDIGFKAQSVQTLEEAAGYKIADKKNLTVSLSEDGKQYGLKYEKFIPILVKAIQDQDAIIQSLTARIAALES